MIKNYFKLALKVLGRNKLYTLISLFGISFTLAVLMLSSAFIDNEFGKKPPISQLDKIQVIPFMRMVKWKREITKKLDTVMVNGQPVIDTVEVEKILRSNNAEEHESQSNSTISYDFFKKNMKNLKHAQYATAFSPNQRVVIFPNNKKMTFSTIYIDENYFNVFDFQFLEGQPFGKDAIDNQSNYAVISRKAAREYFGKQDSYVGKVIQHNEKQYEIVGVVKRVDASLDVIQGEFFVPLTILSESVLNSWGSFGACYIAYLSKTKNDLVGLGEELRNIEQTVPFEDTNGTKRNRQFDDMQLMNNSIHDYYARNFLQTDKPNPSRKLFLFFGISILAFLLIPTINLINLNTTRILERSAEIGVRKSFGAKTSDLIIQFVFENIILTLIGGAIGFLLTIGVMTLLNSSGILGKMHLSLNPKLFLIGLFVTILFGILSGLFPAWKMSKIEIAKAIKTNSI